MGGGGGGGGEAEGERRLPLEGRGLRSPLPRRVGEGERERGRAGQWEGQSPSLGAARRAHGIINRGSVPPPSTPTLPRPNTHTFTLSLGPSFPLFCLLVTRCLLKQLRSSHSLEMVGREVGGFGGGVLFGGGPLWLFEEGYCPGSFS